MRTFLLVLASALALTACQSAPSSSKDKIPADVPAEENAAPVTDTTKTR